MRSKGSRPRSGRSRQIYRSATDSRRVVDGLKSTAATFGQIFDEHQIVQIPLYQRSYSWKPTNISSLWGDIIQTRKMPEEKQTLFLGPVVFHKERVHDKAVVFLVDGQQRLTTISLFLGAFRKLVKKMDSQKAGINLLQLNKHLFRVDSKTKNQVDPDSPPRLHLSKKDKQQFDVYVASGEITGYHTYLKSGIKAVEQLIEDTVNEEVDAELKRAKKEDMVESREDIFDDRLLDLASDFEYMLSSIASFSTISVEEPFDPLTVFESLNSKGMPLAQSDLVKNLLIQHVPNTKQEGISAQWDGLAALLDRKLIDFLRYWYIARHGFIRKKELYESIKKLIQNPGDVNRLMEHWRVAADWFKAIMGETAPPNGDSKVEHESKLFARLTFRQATPILLGIALREQYKDLVPAIRMLSSAYIRLFVTASVRGSVFEAKMDHICSEIRKSKDGLKILKAQLEKLMRQHCPELNWKHLRIEDRAVQKYILIELNRQLSKSKTWAPPPTGILEVEHIMPQTRSKGAYSEINDVEYDFYVNHVGNLTLILEEDNPRCSNKKFADKRGIYKEYDGTEIEAEVDGKTDTVTKDLALTRHVAEFHSWGIDQIEQRAQELAQLAETKWPRTF